MKVTVAFGDIKVVVPCGDGDITIRQLSELAVTRYLKSVQQKKNSPIMTVIINTLLLARDFGILDWDDNVCEVVDDRELIIARFQSDFHLLNSLGNNAPIVDVPMPSVDSNEYYLCSEQDVDTETGNIIVDCNEHKCRVKCRKNRPLLPVSTDSYTYNWDIPSTNQCRNRSADRRRFSRGKSSIHKRLSVDAITSSFWPVPPPPIEPINVTKTPITVANVIQDIGQKVSNSPNLDSPYLAYFSYPHSNSLSTDSEYVKKSPLMNKITSEKGGSSDNAHAPSSLSSSLPSNTDAKSMPQSYYSSMEYTAVSDSTNSSNHDELLRPSTITNCTEFNDRDGRIFFSRDDPELPNTSDCENTLDKYTLTESPNETITHTNVPVHCDLSDIQEEDLSIRSKLNQSLITMTHHPLLNSSNTITSSNLPLLAPTPPLRSEFTKLSSNPSNVAFQSSTINSIDDSNRHLVVDKEVRTTAESTEIEPQVINILGSNNSIQSLFESELHMIEDLDNEWSVSERSADLESMAATTETSIYTTTTATNSFNTSNQVNDRLVITLKKSLNGFGFSLTSRQNAVDLTNPVYVSKVLENGPAISDGRMKAGDRILMINDNDVRHLSQKDIKEILLNVPVESSVKIILGRPSSDSISNILGSSNASTMQAKNLLPKMFNHTTDAVTDEINQISVEEQKPINFPKCTCVQKPSSLSSNLNVFHFLIPQIVSKSEHLSHQSIERPPGDTLPKAPEIKTEPPAIQLHHQNQLSSRSLPVKHTTSFKHPNATLGISVRNGVSQLSFGNTDSVCHKSASKSSNSKVIPENVDKFYANGYYGNVDDKSQKVCPKCGGLLSLTHGVFVKEIIEGGAAKVDGRLANGDEIIAVQGISLYSGEEFLLDNKIMLGDPFDSNKFAQTFTHFQSQIGDDVSTSNIDIGKKSDPVVLLKQILNHAQSTSHLVSLVILRKSLENNSCSINTSAIVDTNPWHNVTVAADVHTHYKKEDTKGSIFKFIRPQRIKPNDIRATTSSIKEKVELFEDIHIRDNRQRFFKQDSDNPPIRNTSTNLICLDSEHETDDPCIVNVDINSNHSISPNNNVHPAYSHDVSSKKFTEFEDSSNIEGRVFSLENLDRSLPSSFTSFQAPTDNNFDFNHSDLLYPMYFSREDNNRQSFSLKRVHLNSSTSSRKSRLSLYRASITPHLRILNTKDYANFKRPKSEVILSRVEEEMPTSDIDETSNFEDRTKTIDRNFKLKRHSIIKKRSS